jgi:Protein of unknown function (DUF2752)
LLGAFWHAARVTAESLVPARLAPLRSGRWSGAAGRYVAVAAGAIGLGALHLRHRPATVCIFRAVTGVPCPFCGGTTAAVHLGHGDVVGALRASPLAVGMLAIWPLIGSLGAPRWWQNRRLRWLALGTVLTAAEIWQLVRFGIIAF